MNKIFAPLLLLFWIVSCENQSPISYKDAGETIHFENTAIKLVIDQNMKIVASYFDGEKTQSMVSDQLKPNDYLVINGKDVYEFSVEKKELTEIENNFGVGKQLKLFGKAKVTTGETTADIEKILTIELYNNFPNSAITYVDYINLSDSQIMIDKTVGASYTVDRKLLDQLQK